MLRSGASGFLVKDIEPEDLLRSVPIVARGDALLSPAVTRAVIARSVRAGSADARPRRPPPELTMLTARENNEVVQLVASGLSNDEIAAQLVVSLDREDPRVPGDGQVGAPRRAQLVVYAYQAGLAIPAPTPRGVGLRRSRRWRVSAGGGRVLGGGSVSIASMSADAFVALFTDAAGALPTTAWRMPWPNGPLFTALCGLQLASVVGVWLRPSRLRVWIAATPALAVVAEWAPARAGSVPGPNPWTPVDSVVGFTDKIADPIIAAHTTATSPDRAPPCGNQRHPAPPGQCI